MRNLAETEDKTLIDLLLDEQKAFDTPVGRLSEEATQLEAFGRGPVYDSLVPLTIPEAGQQYGFQIDLDRCSGCKGCVTACHSLNGLDENETWRDVGTLIAEEGSEPFQQTVTSACHHCIDPACLNGCPVNAYEKDSTTGIVMHLDDQCIGCQYCVLKCPYDVPKYNKKRGIVRKCDMCYSRLAVGEAPACVDACPHEAIKITIVDTEDCRTAATRQGALVPSAPESAYTVPSSSYHSRKPLPDNLVSADSSMLRVQPTHWPLVFMLALTQLGLGGFLAYAFLGITSTGKDLAGLISVSWALMHLGLLASVGHLGKPLKAWRIFLGFRKSWLSREALLFGAASVAATLTLGLAFLQESDRLAVAALLSTILLSAVAVFCSAYLYHDTQRKYWRLSTTLGKFCGTTLIGAVGLALLFDTTYAVNWGAALGLLFVVKIWIEIQSTKNGSFRLSSAKLVSGPLRNWWRARLGTGIAGVLGLSLIIGANLDSVLAWGAFTLLALGEFIERALFFKAVDATKMPGGFN